MGNRAIAEQELDRLRNAKDPHEWDAACDAIKKNHNGYPDDWWSKVVKSGLMADVAERWGMPDAFRIRLVEID